MLPLALAAVTATVLFTLIRTTRLAAVALLCLRPLLVALLLMLTAIAQLIVRRVLVRGQPPKS